MTIYSKDDPMYANDLSFMTDQDWYKLNEARKAKENPKYPLPTQCNLDRQQDRQLEPY